METTSKESRIILAIQALKGSQKLSIRSAARIYNVSETTLRERRAGRPARRDIAANSRKLTDLEESVIVQHILELDSKGFPPRLCGVEDMANRLLADRDALPVGSRWATNFVKRQAELQTRFQRKYDY